VENGWKVSIFSKKRKSHLYGAQYLHAPIPGLTPDAEEPREIRYSLTGDVDGYREKVYGGIPVKVSPEALNMTHSGWDIRAAYDAAWDRYESAIFDTGQFGPELLGMASWSGNVPDPAPITPITYGGAYPLVVSTIPLPYLCYKSGDCQFHSTEVWALGDAPDRGQHVAYRPEPNTVECNGTRDVGWYRAANVFDHVTMEWPAKSKPPLPGVASVTKPIYTTCVCFRGPESKRAQGFRFVPLGRYGTWTKSVLTHHAYTQAAQL
jgi:hypothetical protein